MDFLWREMLCREKEGAFQLDHSPPDEFLARITVDKIRVSGLVEVLTLLGKAAGMERTNGGETRWSVAEGDSRFIAACQQGLVMAAISRLKEHLRLKREDVEAVLALKQTFDSLPADQFRHWNGWEPYEIQPGVQALHIPYPEYRPVVQEWNVAVYCTPFYIDPYRVVPGKDERIPPPRFLRLGEPGHPSPEEFFANADLDEVRQYMAVALRGEKWCEGHIAREFELGVIQAAFQRLEDLVQRDR
ncbi:MAG: DUF6508 domain-containing protein [Nitrospirae bacterium]|nr:DUF6508 domain-containing protein [Fimbriimonadaceae bacterium]